LAYAAKDITVLKGLEPVRERPGMYIGSTGPSGLHHLVYEVVDNSIDEAMAGYCDRIDVTLLADGGCRVTDNGRGIPVDNHRDFKNKSAAEVIMTTLHAGGKFGGEGYKISGGLHGVGVSVVNALSDKLDLEIHRDGGKWEQHFAKGGKPQGKLQKVATSRKKGTTVTFWPDPRVFEETEFRAQTILERLREMAFLNKGLEIRFVDERPRPRLEQTYKYSGGVVDFVKHLNASKDPLFKRVIALEESSASGEVEIAMQWNTGFHEGLHSFANNIATTEGGMHEEGFKKALTNAVNKYAKVKGLVKDKDVQLLGEDIREGMTAILSVKLQNPQFEGQTKSKLGNTEMRSFVEKATNEKLGDWLEEHPPEARQIMVKATQAARARIAARQARDLTRRKSLLDSSAMPGKLADCSSNDPSETELFIVEGDSAGGSAKRARDPRIQAILPIRGKILNVERARIDKMLKNEEIQALITAIGTGVAEDFDGEKVRYHKVIVMSVEGDEPVLLTDEEGHLELEPIGRVVDGWLADGIDTPGISAVSVDKISKRSRVSPMKKVIRHHYRGWMHTLKTAYGRSISVTAGHSVYVYEAGRITTRPVAQLGIGDLVVAPRRLPRAEHEITSLDLLELFVVNGLGRGLRVDGESVRRRNADRVAAQYPAEFRVDDRRMQLPVAEWRRLAARRRALGITQQQMAEAIGHRQACTVSEFETGRTRPSRAAFRAYLAVVGEDIPEAALEAPSRLERWTDESDGSHNARWRRAGHSCRMDELTVDDLVLLDGEVEVVPQAHRDRAFGRHLPITEELCYFLGWYAAEGTTARRSQVALALGEEDARYIPSIISAIQSVFGENPRLHIDRRHARSWKLYFHSPLAARLVVALGLGGHAHEKRVPNLMFNVSTKCQTAFLEGLYLGDGSKGCQEGRVVFSTVASALATGILYLLGQLGITASRFAAAVPPTNNLASAQTVYTVQASGKDQLLELENVWRRAPNADRMRKYATSGRRGWSRWVPISDDLMALPVRSNVARPFNGDVYDLSVADDENFVCGHGGGVLVKNTDADVDGSHIRTLLLTFFFRQLQNLITQRCIYIAQPPLYRADIGKERHYLKDDAALRAFEADHEGRKLEVMRFKGLGEMDWEELKVTTMDPATRTLLQISAEDAAIADEVFSKLMGEDVETRRHFIQENAKDVRFIDA